MDIELFLTFIIIFVPIFISFIIICRKDKDIVWIWFLIIFIFFHVFHLIVLSLLLSNNFYKKSIIWKNNDYQYIHSLPINPCKNISINSGINVESFINLKYTIKKTNVFDKECLNNFFIKEDDCPITEIIFDNNSKNDYSNYKEIKLNNSLDLYYSNDNKNGNLYFYNFNNDSNINMNNLFINLSNTIFNFTDYNEKEIIKEKKIIKVIKDLKYYSDYSDLICLSLFFLSTTFLMSNLVLYSNFNQVINIIIQIILLILYIIRYIKFINLKNIFNKNKDFILNQYENNDTSGYFPNKYFNID